VLRSEDDDVVVGLGVVEMVAEFARIHFPSGPLGIDFQKFVLASSVQPRF
jgi:hypothetical protein